MDNHLLAKIGQYALITNSEKQILLLQRAGSGKWSLPGGRINVGEEWKESFVREVKDETGLEIVEVKPFSVQLIADPYQTKYCVFFEVKVSDHLAVRLSEEHASYKWFSSVDLENMLIDDEPKITETVRRFITSRRSV